MTEISKISLLLYSITSFSSQNILNAKMQTVVRTAYRTEKVVSRNDLVGVFPVEVLDECKNSKILKMQLVRDMKNTEIKKGKYRQLFIIPCIYVNEKITVFIQDIL